MARELIYTSARRGLRPGTSGFCTVAYTRGMSPIAIRLLESLSAYKSLYDGHDQRCELNPVAYSHYRYTLEGRSVSVLSRVGYSGADHTNRANKIAHHLLIDARERPVGGPGWLAMRDDVLLRRWEEEPHQKESPLELPEGDYPSSHAAAWEKLAGDAGWAGVLAHAYEARPTVPAFLVFEPGMDVLPLLAEAMALVQPDKRWLITFNTYFTFLPAGTTCCWRCCVPGSDGTREARRISRALILDLTKPLGEPPDNPLVQCAREGTPPPAPKPDHGAPRFQRLSQSRRAAISMRPELPGDRDGHDR